MLKNYFKIALRNLKTNKGYTLLNLFGLVTGLTCSLVLFQYVAYQKSFDGFNPNAGQIARLSMDFHDQGKLTMQSASVFPGVAPLMKNEFPEVKNYCRLVSARVGWWGVEPAQWNIVFSNDDQNIKAIENTGFYADPSFLQMFAVSFLKGDANNALDGPDKIVISEAMAAKYFGGSDPSGELMTVHEGGQIYHYQITGVFKNYPKNSHLSFDYLISYKTFISLIHTLGKGKEQDPDMTLGWYDFWDYLQLQPGTDLKTLEAKFPAFCLRHHINSQGQRAQNNRTDFYLTPLRDIHLYSHLNEEASVNGDGKAVSFLFLVAFIIIAIAWVNYTNLATARSLERAREVGVRKLLGALRAHLIFQFLIESLLLNLASLIIALVFAVVLSPVYSHLLAGDGSFGFHLPAAYTLGFAALFLAGTLLSGIYPAFVLSGYTPITVLKGAFKNSGKGQFLRKGLIIGQFATSVVLIVGTIIVFQQVSFMRNQQLGANIDRTVVLNGPVSVPDTIYRETYKSFKDELLQISGVKSMSASTSVMGKEIYYDNGAMLQHSLTQQYYTFAFVYTDYDFVPAYDIKILAGRNFSTKFVTDTSAVLLNEAAIKLFGITSAEAALKETVMYDGAPYKVVGVLADFHQLGLNTAVNPTVFVLRPPANNFYSIKLNSADMQQTVAAVQKIWSEHFPADPFSFFFLNEAFDQQYKADVQFGNVFGIFSFLAICIACFGLLSLSAYNVIQRTKEIGIRKVLGASVSGIFVMLSREMVMLVAMGILAAIPIAWFVMHLWLQDFAYRITIHWWVFALAGIASLLIALLTVSYQAIKAALTNPVKSLRTE